MLANVSREDLRQVQAKMRVKLRPRPKNVSKEFQPKRLWSDATINRHFSFLRHVLMLAVKDGKLTQNPVSGLKFFSRGEADTVAGWLVLSWSSCEGSCNNMTGSWSLLRLKRD